MARSRMVIGFQAFRESLGIGIMFGWPIQQSDCGDFGYSSLAYSGEEIWHAFPIGR